MQPPLRPPLRSVPAIGDRLGVMGIKPATDQVRSRNRTRRDMMGTVGTGLRPFKGSPKRPGEVGRMRAAGDHKGTISRAAPAAPPAMPGPWRDCILRQFISPPDLSPLPVTGSSSSAGDHPPQPYPIRPPTCVRRGAERPVSWLR
jgi:hypothetical protein